MKHDAEHQSKPVTARWVKVALAVSLALNLATAGVIVGSFFRSGGPGPRSGAAPEISAFGAPYMRALTKTERRDIARHVRSSLGTDLPDRRARRAMFREVLASLRAEPFDEGRLVAATARQADTAVAVQRAARQAWVEKVSKMSPEERSRYADAVEAGMKRAPIRR